MANDAPISWHALTGFDWFLLVVVLVSALLAFQRGLVRVLFSLAGMVAGILLASWNYVCLGGWLQRWMSSVQTSQIVAFVAILLGVMLVFSIAAGIVRGTLKAVGLGFADRLLGAAAGVVRGMLLGVAAMMAMAAFVPDSGPGSGLTENSLLAPYFLRGAHAVSFVVPRGFEQQIRTGAERLIKKTPKVLNR
jgi:membrane protein required for colicin V production